MRAGLACKCSSRTLCYTTHPPPALCCPPRPSHPSPGSPPPQAVDLFFQTPGQVGVVPPPREGTGHSFRYQNPCNPAFVPNFAFISNSLTCWPHALAQKGLNSALRLVSGSRGDELGDPEKVRQRARYLVSYTPPDEQETAQRSTAQRNTSDT